MSSENRRKPEAEEIVAALRAQKVDAIISEGGVALVRLREVELELERREEELAALNASLEDQVAERTEALQKTAKRMRALASEVVEAEERERKRIAKVLHNGVQQLLAAAEFQVEAIGKSADLAPSLQDRVAFVRTVIHDAMSQTRELSHDIAGTSLENHRFEEAIEHLAGEMDRKHGLRTKITVGEGLDGLGSRMRTFLYRAVQELLFNVVKHAETGIATVSVVVLDGRVELSVTDNGKGFDPTAVEDDGSDTLGLSGLRTRASDLGATFSVESEVGAGTRVSIYFPLNADGHSLEEPLV